MTISSYKQIHGGDKHDNQDSFTPGEWEVNGIKDTGDFNYEVTYFINQVLGI